MCPNETYSKINTDKNTPETVPIQNGLKHGNAISPLLFNFALEYGETAAE
jgi:hypothetical protein